MIISGKKFLKWRNRVVPDASRELAASDVCAVSRYGLIGWVPVSYNSGSRFGAGGNGFHSNSCYTTSGGPGLPQTVLTGHMVLTAGCLSVNAIPLGYRLNNLSQTDKKRGCLMG